jgi:hypothetical protein
MSDKKTEATLKTTNKKSFWDRVKSIALEEEVVNNPSSETTTSSTAQSATHTPSKFVYSDQKIPPFSKGQFDEKLFSGFIQHMEEKNLEGIDYLEFSKAKKNMDNIPGMNEPLKYQSAFASLKANSDITKDHLLTTADFYIKELDSQKLHFEEEMRIEIENEVTNRIKEVEQKTAEILKLQNQINELNLEISELNSAAALAEQNIKATENNFNITIEVVKSQILQDKENIKNFIN